MFISSEHVVINYDKLSPPRSSTFEIGKRLASSISEIFVFNLGLTYEPIFIDWVILSLFASNSQLDLN